jgi:RHS repeat-associated protein
MGFSAGAALRAAHRGSQDKRYRYDRFGRLSEKRTGGNRIQRFTYDAEHRLVCVEQTRSGDVERIVFGYDPLGRRISKAVYKPGIAEPVRRTLFHWQGLRLLQEVQRGMPSLYVYASPGSYEPLARIDGRPGQEEMQYFHTNLAGLPEQLTDEQGHTLWRSDYRGWGNTRDEWHSPRQEREQNLRYQGQYLDREIELHYNTFRYFDFNIGRYVQPDPINLHGGINLYQYGPNSIGWIDPLGLTSEFGLAPYGSAQHARDGLTAHELLQNAWLRNHGHIASRESGIARENPAVALQESEMHKIISKLQRQHGLHNPTNLKRQSALQNINRNTAITRRGIYEDLVLNRGWERANAKTFATLVSMRLRDQAIKFAQHNGLIKCQ